MHCRSDDRSALASDFLVLHGYTNVWSVGMASKVIGPATARARANAP